MQLQPFFSETNMRFAFDHQSSSLRCHYVFQRTTCWWRTQPPLGIAKKPNSCIRNSRQRHTGSACSSPSRIFAAKSSLDVPAVTSVEGRTLTVHYLRRNADVQVGPSEGHCVNVRSPRQLRQDVRMTRSMQSSPEVLSLVPSVVVSSPSTQRQNHV